jgi:hypothetical protein
VKERDAELAAGLQETQHDIARGPACIAHGATGDFSLGHASADVVFGTIGVERDLRTLQHPEQLEFASMKPRKEAIQKRVTRAARKDAIDPSPRPLAQRRGRGIRHPQWGDWFNNRRLLEPIGNIPPAEAGARYYVQANEHAIGMTQTKQPPANPGRFIHTAEPAAEGAGV